MKKTRRTWILVLLVIVLLLIIPISKNNTVEGIKSEKTFLKSDYSVCFKNDCPVCINGKVELVDYYNPFIRLKLNISNVVQNPISSIKLLFVCKNVYGEEINLYTANYDKNPIEKDCFISLSYKVNHKIRFVDVKVYDVYFKENTENEWGKRDLKTKDIKEYAPTVCSLSL